MKNALKNIVRLLCFIFIICLLTYTVTAPLQLTDKKDMMHIRGFFLEPENSLDVVMIGASELYTGFCSPMAWNQYGFTSYSFCCSGMLATHYKPAVQEIMTRQNPKLLVIEINAFMQKDSYHHNMTKNHTFIDNLPHDKLRNQIIRDIIPKENQAEFYFGFIKYHENWKHIRACFNYMKNKFTLYTKGQTYTKSFASNNKKNKKPKYKTYYPQVGSLSEKCLTDLLDYLRENKIENVLFVRFPHCFNNKNPQEYNKIADIINSYGYKFVDYDSQRNAIGLDAKEHYYNPEHMNIFGMEIFTSFFAGYLSSNYDIKSTYSKEVTDCWNECWAKTEKLIDKCKTENPVNDNKSFYELDGYYV